VAGVRIDTGPIDHDTPWEKVPPGGRILILGAWRQFFHVDVKYDCRELLRIVEDIGDPSGLASVRLRRPRRRAVPDLGGFLPVP
jgi:hypothetical protein